MGRDELDLTPNDVNPVTNASRGTKNYRAIYITYIFQHSRLGPGFPLVTTQWAARQTHTLKLPVVDDIWREVATTASHHRYCCHNILRTSSLGLLFSWTWQTIAVAFLTYAPTPGHGDGGIDRKRYGYDTVTLNYL